jgi:predicted PurR-regulated permease PerM
MPSGKHVVLALLLAGLVALGFLVLRPFLVPVAWALIISYVTWPAYSRLRRLLRESAGTSALLMTLLLTCACILPVLWLMKPLTEDLRDASRAIVAYFSDRPRDLPDFLARIPWIGSSLQAFLDHVEIDPPAIRSHLSGWANRWTSEIGDILGSAARNATKLGFALVTLFFAYRDGESLLNQIRQALRPFLGERLDDYLTAIGSMTRSVVYGIVLTAIAQAVLAGLGYWAAGVAAPVTLAGITALVALIPFGTPLVWVPVAVGLLFAGRTVAGVGLLLWGMLVISWVDNLIRPFVISSSARIPFLLVMFGVLGGLAAFGLIGLFLGPAILAVLMALWREWQTEAARQQLRQPVQRNDTPK